VVGAHQLTGNALASPSLQYVLNGQSLCAVQTFLHVGPPGDPSSTHTLPVRHAGDWPHMAGRGGADDDEHPDASSPKARRSDAVHTAGARLADTPLT